MTEKKLDFYEIGKNIDKYLYEENFTKGKTLQDMCQILDYANLSPTDFTAFFQAVSNDFSKEDVFKMLQHAKIHKLDTKFDAEDISSSLQNLLNIDALKQFGVYLHSHDFNSPFSRCREITINVRIVLENGSSQIINVLYDHEVGSIRYFLQQKYKVAANRIKLFYKGKEMIENDTFQQLGFKSYDVIRIKFDPEYAPNAPIVISDDD